MMNAVRGAIARLARSMLPGSRELEVPKQDDSEFIRTCMHYNSVRSGE
jgi:hypothetical protein